jgi:hypothetical protein
MIKTPTDAIQMVFNNYAERHLDTSLVYQVAKAELQALLDDRNKWRNIAGNLYDEMRLRGADCLYRHEDATKDCVKDYELADELSAQGDKQ